MIPPKDQLGIEEPDYEAPYAPHLFRKKTYFWKIRAPWCITHSCQFFDEKAKRCMWDVQAGPRPGRGQCVKLMVDLRVEEVVRDDDE